MPGSHAQPPSSFEKQPRTQYLTAGTRTSANNRAPGTTASKPPHKSDTRSWRFPGQVVENSRIPPALGARLWWLDCHAP